MGVAKHTAAIMHLPNGLMAISTTKVVMERGGAVLDAIFCLNIRKHINLTIVYKKKNFTLMAYTPKLTKHKTQSSLKESSNLH